MAKVESALIGDTIDIIVDCASSSFSTSRNGICMPDNAASG